MLEAKQLKWPNQQKHTAKTTTTETLQLGYEAIFNTKQNYAETILKHTFTWQEPSI